MPRTVRTTIIAALTSSFLFCGHAAAAPIISDRQIAPKPPTIAPTSAAHALASRWARHQPDGILVKSSKRRLQQQAERLTARPATSGRVPLSW